MFQCRGYISLAVFCMALLTAQNAYALRCDGGLIGEGDAINPRIKVKDGATKRPGSIYRASSAISIPSLLSH
ncbi:MAG: hypothetical protein RRB22_00685 [Gammaproteobacteria bacterium]|nr:hypothetical protein [Gammaproteobacteria bacterium]